MRQILTILALLLFLILSISCSKKTDNSVEPVESIAWTRVTSDSTNILVDAFVANGSNIFAGYSWQWSFSFDK